MNVRLLLAITAAFTMLAASTSYARSQRWMLPIDSRNTDQWVSARANVIYTISNGHVVAIDAATGVTRWTSTAVVVSRPAIGGSTIYAPVPNGILALDAQSGVARGVMRVTGTPTLLTSDEMAVALVRGTDATIVLGLRDTLRPHWRRQFEPGWSRPFSAGFNVVVLYGSHSADVLALDSHTGNAVAAADGVDDYVGRDGRTLWFSVAGGGLKGLDLDKNTSVAIHDSVVRGAVRVEGKTAVAVIDGRLVKLALPSGAVQALPIHGRWVGGPIAGVIFVARSDGMYGLRLDGGKPSLLATNISDTRFLTAQNRRAFFQTNDGSIVVADTDTLKPIARWPTDCTFVEGVHLIADGALVHCDLKTMSTRLYAFSF